MSNAEDRSRAAVIAPVLLTDAQSAALFGISVRFFHELRAEAWMARPITLGPRLLRWHRAELEAAISKMPRLEQPKPEPAQLLKSRVARAKLTGNFAPMGAEAVPA